MRFLFTLGCLAATGYGFWWFSETRPDVREKAEQILSIGSINTLEVRYSASQIMESQQKKLLKGSRHKFLEPSMKFYPYILMDVKYAVSDKKTKEGVILWDLTDGEMVIETKSWKKTHGFGDCMSANTDGHEFKILHILASKGGAADRESLSKGLHVENEILDAWVESCRKKSLIVPSGNGYRLHLEKPLFQNHPSTKIDERLVTKPQRYAQRISGRFSLSQIEKLAKAAFGNDFAIRKTINLYLPVHCIRVQNPDDSIHTSHWNALNGKRMNTHFVD